jgi:response regulator NasT
MRAWLLQGKQGEDPGGLWPALREWAERPANNACRLDLHPLSPDLPARVQSFRPEVLVLSLTLCPSRPWLEEVLALEVGFVAAGEEGQVGPYQDLAERHPLVFTPPRPGPEVLGLALWGARAALRRQLYWKTQVEQLHQRLNDRIVIERAKGVLVQRLGIGEEEAYKRLRLLSRRQRRQIRDIAQSLLDTRELLLPADNGYPGPAAGATPPAEPGGPPAGEGGGP